MTNPDYNFTVTGSGLGGLTISVITSEGEILQVQEGASNFRRLYDALAENGAEDDIIALARPVLYIGSTLRRVSERIGFDGINVTFDGDILNNNLSRQLIGLLSDTASANAAQSLVAFIEKIYSNPSKQSQESLYEFIKRYNISILPDGDFIAYKGVKRDGRSIHKGYGIVDGVVFENAHLQNNAGSTIEIPRSKVDADTAIGCSTGLHAGSYAYASGFAQGLLLTVKINPRDVVSVPDCSTYQKIRVSRYLVLSTTEVQLPELYIDFDDENDWSRDDEDDYDDEDGYDDDDSDDENDNSDDEENIPVATNVNTAASELDKSIHETIELIFDADSEENFIQFTYPIQGTSDRKTVKSFKVESVAEKANWAGYLHDATFTGLNQEGDYRSYLYSKMENINVDKGNAFYIVEAEIITPTNRLQSPFQVD